MFKSPPNHTYVQGQITLRTVYWTTENISRTHTLDVDYVYHVSLHICPKNVEVVWSIKFLTQTNQPTNKQTNHIVTRLSPFWSRNNEFWNLRTEYSAAFVDVSEHFSCWPAWTIPGEASLLLPCYCLINRVMGKRGNYMINKVMWKKLVTIW